MKLESKERLTFRTIGVRGLRIPFIKIPQPSNPFSSTLSLLLSFGVLILVGFVLLMLPISSKSGTFTSPVDALFTATSAACVTGLTVLDSGTHWNTFGQGVLLVLFQIGGIGFISGATLLLLAVNRRYGLKERLAVSRTLGIERLSGTLAVVATVSLFSIVIEAVGAVIFYFRWSAAGDVAAPLWTAVFHSVSSFNNCGMDILGNFASLSIFKGDSLTLGVTAVLVIIGSTGYIVIFDLFRSNRSFNKLALESKMVLIITPILLGLGTLFIFILEYSNSATLGPLQFPQKLMISFFQSVSPRTAGFTVVDVGSLKQITLFFVIFLMFIGGSVGSTAGGIKINTVSVLALTVLSLLKGKNAVEAFGRQLTEETIYRAVALFVLYLSVAALVVLVLSITEVFPIDKIIFEAFSSLSTVGLTAGITPHLSTPGRIVIIIAMFVGRLGPLALIAFLAGRHQPTTVEYPHESIRLG